jgi:hypothetical protein
MTDLPTGTVGEAGCGERLILDFLRNDPSPTMMPIRRSSTQG